MLSQGEDITIDAYFPKEAFLDNANSFEALFFTYKIEFILNPVIPED